MALASSLGFKPEVDAEGKIGDASVGMPNSPKEGLLVNLQNLGGYTGRHLVDFQAEFESFRFIRVFDIISYIFSLSKVILDEC